MLALFDFKAILVTALIFIPLEMLLPSRKGQKLLRNHWRNDGIYLLFHSVIIKIGLLLVAAGLLSTIHTIMPRGIERAIQSQPIWLQAIEVLVTADIGFYFAHRCFHAIPSLWKFHAIHHSIQEMDWLAAYRVHPLDQIATKTASFLPIFLLGFSNEAIVIFALVY